MENNNIDVTSYCLMCKYRFTSSYKYMIKTLENRDVALVKHLLDYHLDFKVADCPGLIQNLFKNEFKESFDMQQSIIDILTLLLEKGAKLKFKNNPDLTLLKSTIDYRLWMVYDFFLGYDKNWIEHEIDGKPTMMYLIESEHRKFVKYTKSDGNIDLLVQHSANFIKWMLQKGLDVDCMDENGETALILATKYKLLHALPILLNKTKVTTICNNSGLTAFQVFVQSAGRFDKNNLNRNNIINYYFPDSYYDKTIVNLIYELFVGKGFSVNDIDEHGLTPVHYALNQKRIDIAKRMLINFKNVYAHDEYGNTILQIIVNHCKSIYPQSEAYPYHEMASILVEKGANVYQTNNHGSSPILDAVMDENIFLLDKFKEQGIVLRDNYKKSNLLHLYCKFMNSQQHQHPAFSRVIDLLVDEGCDINAKDAQEMTPLHYAVRGNKIEIVKKLIDCAADINSRHDSRGYTPLHEVIYSNAAYRDEVFMVLIDKGADVNAKTNTGLTPLHMVNSTLCGAVEKMIKKGAHVDIADNLGFLPLHTAIYSRDHQKIKDLLRFGADINDNAHVLEYRDYVAVGETLSEHFIKMRRIGLPIAKEFNHFLLIMREMPGLEMSCITELEGLRKQEIGENISVYDFLHSNSKNSYRLVKNEDLIALVNTPGLEKWFPNYHGFITSKYYKAVERPNMIEPAMWGWYELTNIRLPELCMYEILSYLSNASLRVLMEGNYYVGNR